MPTMRAGGFLYVPRGLNLHKSFLTCRGIFAHLLFTASWCKPSVYWEGKKASIFTFSSDVNTRKSELLNYTIGLHQPEVY